MPYMHQLAEFLCLTRSLHEANEKRIEKCKSEGEKDLQNGEKKMNWKRSLGTDFFFQIFPMYSLYLFLIFMR